MKANEINELIGVQEAYKAADKLTEHIIDKERREALFMKFLDIEQDLSYDWFTDYFQSEHGDRVKLKQDYTPVGIAEICAGMLPHAASVLDICAGVGGLTIQVWKNNPQAFFRCEELASRAIPFLLFNLSIRGIEGEVLQGNTLTREYEHVYKLTRNGRFSDIEECERARQQVFDAVITNPPYSLTWNPVPDERFAEYGLPPKSKADYAFIMHGLHYLAPGGTLSAILPHGVLFRGQAEGTIREQILRHNLLDGIIGLPEKSFLNTGIPVAVIVLKKDKNEKDCIIIDASDECEKRPKLNIITAENVQRVLTVYKTRKPVERFANVADFAKLEKEGFNLNIPRYVNTFIPEPVEPLDILIGDLISIEKEIKKTETNIAEIMATKLTGFDKETKKQIELWHNSLTTGIASLQKLPRLNEQKQEKHTQLELF